MNPHVYPYAVFDLDGTLADIEHRLHHVTGKEKRWDRFYAPHEIQKDRPIYQNIGVLKAISEAEYIIVILTGRSEEAMVATAAWLANHKVPHDVLAMRREGDHRPDTTVKRELAHDLEIRPDNTLAIWEDRQRVVDMWRSMRFTVHHVADGRY